MSQFLAKKHQARIVFYGSILGILAVICFGWWQGSGQQLTTSSDQLIAVARLFGLLASFSILLEVLLMSRIPLFERNFSLEETVELHRLNGYFLLSLIIGHIVFVVIGYNAGMDGSFWQQFLNLNNNFEDVFKATVGTVIFFCVTFLTFGVVRKHLRYELWYITHLLVYVAILLTFLHQVNIGGDLIKYAWFKYFWFALFGLVFTMLAYFRFAVMFVHAFRFDFRVLRVVKEATDIYSIYIGGNNVRNFMFIPGQYASWRFLDRALWFEAHPFSFSLSPGNDVLRVTAKTHGDFSKKLLGMQKGTKVLLDGPRGAFTSRLATTKSVTLIAGGIGIAPFISKIPVLLATGKKVTLLYSVRNSSELAFLDELKAFEHKGLILHVFITGKSSRINTSDLVATVTLQTTVFICGPDAMTKALPETLMRLGLSKKNVITERFGF